MENIQSVLIYETEDSAVVSEVLVMNETLWMTQKQMANLFDADKSVVSRHLRNIFDEGELREEATLAKIERVQNEGDREVSRQVSYYNLDAIIALGYRVNSKKATQFRIWATGVLKEYMIKGFALDDDRLKQGETLFGEDYFQELLERVRSIRASERRIWQKITDIFAEISTDYDKNSPTTIQFYANVQNKFHYAITGQTAAEIIYGKADRNKPHMGLTTWKNAPDGRILKNDTGVAKNYLSEKEIKQLERNVSGYFDYIEDLIQRKNTFTMEAFAQSIDRFLEFREYKILKGHGTIAMRDAKKKAAAEYEAFNKIQKIESDFDKQIKGMLDKQ